MVSSLGFSRNIYIPLVDCSGSGVKDAVQVGITLIMDIAFFGTFSCAYGHAH